MGQALGILEIRSLAAAIDAANVAVNSSPVELRATSYALPGIVMVAVAGPVDAVSAAVHAVRAHTERTGSLHGWTILARPDAAVEELLAQRAVPIGARAGAPAVRGRGPAHARPVATADGAAVEDVEPRSDQHGSGGSGASGKPSKDKG